MSRLRPNRWLAWVPVLALLCLAAAAATLTKDDVIRMAGAGQGDQAILDAIHEAHATFDLTANDIADLRQAGVSQKVIDAMIETGPRPDAKSGASQPAPEQTPADQTASDQDNYDQAAPDEPPPPYPYPAPVYYPVYPLYYPAYYPVYDPFFPPFFSDIFFSFGFVHVSNLFTIFPCDRAVVVVNNPCIIGRTGLRGTVLARGSTAVTTGMRVVPRGGTSVTGAATTFSSATSRVGSLSRAVSGPRTASETGVAPGPRASAQIPSRPPRLAASSSSTPGLRPRGSMPPTGGSMTLPRSMQGAPRAPAQSFQRPPRPAPYASVPHGGFAPAPHGGGFAGMAAPRSFAAPRGFAAPRSFSAPRSFAAPRSFGGGHFGGGGHSHGGHH